MKNKEFGWVDTSTCARNLTGDKLWWCLVSNVIIFFLILHHHHHSPGLYVVLLIVWILWWWCGDTLQIEIQRVPWTGRVWNVVNLIFDSSSSTTECVTLRGRMMMVLGANQGNVSGPGCVILWHTESRHKVDNLISVMWRSFRMKVKRKRKK